MKQATTKICTKCEKENDLDRFFQDSSYDTTLCFNCNHWLTLWKERKSTFIVVNGNHFIMGEGKGPGMAGRLFKIKLFSTDDVVECRNLWHQGTVPLVWLEDFPNTAEFVYEQHQRKGNSYYG